jgi:transcriptional regulator with XRE-family HTH domain
MQGPGEGLRLAREAHGKTLEEMSEATGIRLPFLTALEQDAFDSLPGRGFGKLYIRAYAEVLGFDPRPMIDAYDRVVHASDAATSISEAETSTRPVNPVLARWRSELIARRAEAEPSAEPEEEPLDQDEGEEAFDRPATMPRTTAEKPLAVALEDVRAPSVSANTDAPLRPARSRRWLWATLLVLVLPALAYLVASGSRPAPPAPAPRHETAPERAAVPPPPLPPPSKAVEAPRTPPRAEPPAREPITSSSFQVAESGVGLRFNGTRLEGEADHFHAGQRVTFATLVRGGDAGDHIRHVWLRDGKVEQSIRLRLGGASWHTWSTKTLGRPGAWTVEARDEQEHVLARADLTVAP